MKSLKFSVLACLIVCCGALALWSVGAAETAPEAPAAEATSAVTAPQVDVTPIDIPGVTDMAVATPAGPIEVEPIDVDRLPTCNDQSENECKGKKHTEACVKNGVTGTCDAVYPSNECICRT